MSTPARFYVEPQFCQLYRQKKEQPLSKLLFQGAQWDSSPRLSYFVGCEPVGPIPLDSFVNYIDKKKSNLFRNCSFRVPSGIRTHDIQNHNLTL